MTTKRLRFLKSLFPYNDNPAVKLLLYEVQQIQKLVTTPVAPKVAQASQPAPNVATTPSTTPVPIKIEDEPTASAATASVTEGPPVPEIVVTTPGGFIVSVEKMPAWKRMELPSRFRHVKHQRDSNEWLSPPSMYCRKLRKRSKRRQMHNIDQNTPSPGKTT